MLTVTRTRTHTYVQLANPYLVCEICGGPGTRAHDHTRCGCGDPEVDGAPCGHLPIVSTCPSWGPVDGCQCLESLGKIPHGPAPTPMPAC